MRQFVTFFRLFKLSAFYWIEDNAPRLGAALAFYTIFSLAPLMLVLIAIGGLVFGEQAARGELMGSIQGLLGHDGAAAVESLLSHARKPERGILATILGILTLLLGASGVFGQLLDALNTIWKVQPKPGHIIRDFLSRRFRAFAVVLGTGFLLLVSLILSTVLAVVEKYLSDALPGGATVWHILNITVSFCITASLFATMYKVLPDVNLSWRDVGTGAVFTAILFSLGRYLIGTYLGTTGVTSVYGAAGSFVLVLLWVYYSTQILFFGAEFTKAHAQMRGSGKPKNGFIKTEPEVRKAS